LVDFVLPVSPHLPPSFANLLPIAKLATTHFAIQAATLLSSVDLQVQLMLLTMPRNFVLHHPLLNRTSNWLPTLHSCHKQNMLQLLCAFGIQVMSIW
jgi:hypothetical protein